MGSPASLPDVIKALALDIDMTLKSYLHPYQELIISSNLGMLLARKWRMLHVRDLRDSNCFNHGST